MQSQILPIFLLPLLGVLLRRFDFLSQNSVEALKKIVINLALPSVLFLSFLRLELDLTYVSLSAAVFSVCLCLFIIAKAVNRLVAPSHPYFPFMATGFEYGMLGVALYGGVYGLENIKYIAVIDLGHEIFIWFIMLPFLLLKKQDQHSTANLVKTFVTNPVILAIVGGIALNAAGMSIPLENNLVTAGIIRSMEFLSQLTVPLILLTLGFGLQLQFNQLKDTAFIICYRYLTVLPLIYVLNRYVISGLFGLDDHFQAALFTLFILPAPFIVPLFMENRQHKERDFINNLLALQTLLCILIFSVYTIS